MAAIAPKVSSMAKTMPIRILICSPTRSSADGLKCRRITPGRLGLVCIALVPCTDYAGRAARCAGCADGGGSRRPWPDRCLALLGGLGQVTGQLLDLGVL